MQRVHIMATQQQINDIAGLYVAYFDRAPDPAGLQFWIDQLDGGRDFATISQDFAESEEAKEIYPFLATPDLVNNSPAAFVTSIYANLFGRAPDTAGLNFWVDVLGNGEVAPGDMVEAIMLGAQDTLVNGQLIQDKTTVEHKIECALAFTFEAADTEGFEFDGNAYSAARQSIEGVDATDASVDAAKAATFQYFSEFVNETTFTLTPAVVEVSPAVEGEVVMQTVLYWGYNPHGHDETGVDNLDGNNPDGNDNNLTNEGPLDGGIPADVFFNEYFPIIASQQFAGVDEIDVDEDDFSIVDFGNLEDINVSAGDGGNGGTITFSYSDGSSDDIALGQAYYDFLCKLILDEEGNTRFFEQEQVARVPVYVDANGEPTTVEADAVGDAIGYVDAVLGGSDAVTATVPIVLTEYVNNGGTTTPGFTTADDDTIVAGQLELLHGATLDGGQGYNTLEVDAKGHFAQPKELSNFQQVTITNLPNIYTNSDNTSSYPDFGNGASGFQDSILDLTRATELENVTIVEGDYDYVGGNAEDEPGAIVVTGLRNDATLTLQGSYYEDVYVRTGAGNSGDGFTIILENVNTADDNGSLYVADNASKLNLVSNGGGNVLGGFDYYDNEGVTDLVISGDAHLFIQGDLGDVFEDDTPATIDASANTAGVDLNINGPEQVTFTGSKGDDRFAVDTNDSDETEQGPDFSNDESVTITNAEGDNYYDIDTYTLELTDGDGDINVEIDVVQGEITLGGGDNHVEGSVVNLVATAGDGDNKFDIRGFDSPQTGPWTFEDDFPTLVDLTAGDGSNIFNVFVDDSTNDGGHFLAAATVNITAGDGGNLVQIPALPFDSGEGVLSTVTVNTGSGTDSILVGGSNITINSGGGSDTITLLGIDDDYATEVNGDKEFEDSSYGAVISIDTGAGSATVNLGAYLDDAFLISGNIVAMEGSSITGEDVTLFVNTHADLRAADLSGITSIVMDDDAMGYSGRGFPEGSDSTSNASSLTLLDTQVVALGEDVFSTQGDSVFGTQSVLTIVVTSDTSLSDLIDLAAWNTSVKLCFVVEDGVTLTMTAEELHTYVAPDGIYVTNTNGYDDNQVVITGAGPNFDAYNDQNGGTGAGTVAGSVDDNDVTVIYVPGGYERPAEDPSINIIEWNSDDTPVIDETVWPFATDLSIEGAADLTVNGPVTLGDNFTIDFSDFGGTFTDTTNGVPTLTVANFDAITEDSDYANWGSIAGNGTSASPVRIDMIVEDGSTTGDTAFGVLHGGFFSSGVQQYVLAAFDDNGVIQSQSSSNSATIVVCDNTEDLEVLGLQNNRNSDVTFEQVNWGTEILFEGDGYADASDQPKNLGNPDLSEVGFITANFFEAGANAFVRITNQGVELGQNEDAEDGYDADGERVLDVAGITVTNADRLRIAVEDGDAVVNAVNGDDVERVIVTGPEDVKLIIEGVDGDDGTGLDSDDLLSIDGSGVVGVFSLCFSDDADLSGVVLTGVDAITLTDGATLTLTGDQAFEFQGLISDDDSGTELVVVEMGEQAIDFSAIDVDNIGDITFSDVDGTITVDPATDFGDADSVEIVAEGSDTTVQMTFAQFGTIDGGDVDVEEDNGFDATLALTDIPTDADVDLSSIGSGADVLLIVEDFVGEAGDGVGDGFQVNPTDSSVTVTMCVSGTSDLSAVELDDLDGLDAIELKDGATLTLTAEQLEELIENRGGVSIVDGGTATLNVSDLSTEELDLDALVADNPGLSIGTITIADTNTAITIDEDTTFGGAAEIITPTADENDPFDGLEDTSVTMTVPQFLSSAGVISGDAMINLTGLANNNDSDGDFVLDEAVLDVSGITAPTGTITLLEEGTTITEVGETVTLAEVTDLSAFNIVLTDGQLIRFKTEAQADGATITEDLVSSANPTGVVWLFTTVSGPVDTSGYHADLNTLFVDEALVNGANEEDLWTTLAGSIVVEKFNDGAPNALVVFNRINTFEAFGAAPDGITFDDTGEYQTTGSVTLNLEGNVNLGDVTIDDSNGEAAFEELTINSYLDIENLPASIDPGITDTTGLTANGGAQLIDGYIIQPNQVGDIYLNAPQGDGDTVTVNLNTADEQTDAAIANGTTGAGSGPDLDAGQPLEVGTIFFGAPGAGENSADLNVTGAHDITIEGIDMSDPALTLVNVNTSMEDVELTIDGVEYSELGEIMGVLAADDLSDLNTIYFLDGFVADEADDFGPGTQPEVIFNVVGGDNDLSAMDGFAPDEGVSANTGFYFSGPATLKLTAAQLEQIGIEDANADGVADNFILGPGVNPGDVTIDICELTSSTGALDLDAIQAAGINIGTITLVDDGSDTLVDLDIGTTLGGADQIVMELDFFDISLELSAEQYNSFSGVIVEDRSEDALTDATIVGTVIIDELESIENATTGEVTIDVTGVATTGDNTFFLQDANDPADADAGGVGEDPTNDVTFSAASDLSDFSVTLYDVDSGGAADELAGQTIRFSTEVQADGRVVLVLGEDGTNPNKDEMDTNVVWLFDTVSGGLDASGYDANLGRIWISDELVDSVGGDVDGLFTIPNPDNPAEPMFTLDSNIIKRIETEDLDALLQLNIGINQRVEITSFTNIAGAEFEIDDPLISIANLRIDMGGATDINDLVLDNILGPVNPGNPNFPGDDDFEELLINSLIANHEDHYLLPDSWTDAIPLPSDDLQILNQANTVGDISSGDDRGVLHTIVINTFDADPTDTGAGGTDEGPADFVGPALGAAEVEGADFVAETIYFSDDGDTSAVGGDAGTPGASLTITGGNDVTVKSLDTSDVDITSLTVDTSGHTGTFTVTGGSPAFDGDGTGTGQGDTTEALTFTNSSSTDGVIQLASTITFDDGGTAENEFNIEYNVGSGETVPYSGVSSGALTSIDASAHAGTISLGVISQVNSEEFTLTAGATGQVFARIGEGLDDGVVESPELSATGTWTVTGGGAGLAEAGGANNLDLEIQAVTFNNGGQLSLNSVDLCITGDIDLSPLDAADITFSGPVTLAVAAGGTLTLSVEQAEAFALAGLTITGEGTLAIVGDADDADFGDLLGTGTVDMSGTTITAGDATGAVDYELQGAMDKAGDWITQNVIGSANNDAVTFDGAVDGAATTLTDGFSFSLALGADDGSIGDAGVVGTVDDATEVVGDVVDTSGLDAGDFVQYNVDAGFDEVNIIETGDQMQVAAGAELQVTEADDFVATSDDTNDGTAVLVADVDSDIDMSDAGGANGWTIIGAADADTGAGNALEGSEQDDVLIDGAADATDGAANGNAGETDTFTGNGGEDLFSFNVSTSTPATFVSNTTTDAEDTEVIEVTSAGTDSAASLLTVEYELNNVTTVAVVNNTNAGFDIDFTDTASIALAIATVMGNINGITAAVDAVTNTQVNLEGDNGNLLNIGAITPNGAAGAAAAAANNAADDADDVAQITEVELTGTVTPGEIYFLTVTLRDGSEIEAQYEAGALDGLDDVAEGLINDALTGFNTLAPGTTIDATRVGAVITLTDEEDDDGGFMVSLSAGQAVLNGSSASSVLDGTETSLADADADVITDFLDDDDSITFGLDAGSNDNYDEDAYAADFVTAQANADAAFAGDADLIYFLTGSTADSTGLLFVNANNDGTADTVVALTGVTEANFDDSNIV
jgi:Domain of unknown function (DUF4214)